MAIDFLHRRYCNTIILLEQTGKFFYFLFVYEENAGKNVLIKEHKNPRKRQNNILTMKGNIV